MRWLRWRKGAAVDHEGKELAKRQLKIARALEAESRILRDEHIRLLTNNHFGENLLRAMRGER